VNEAAESGGGPAGVVEGFSARDGNAGLPLYRRDLESGVEGGLEE
jgi:hypothetical protein